MWRSSPRAPQRPSVQAPRRGRWPSPTGSWRSSCTARASSPPTSPATRAPSPSGRHSVHLASRSQLAPRSQPPFGPRSLPGPGYTEMTATFRTRYPTHAGNTAYVLEYAPLPGTHPTRRAGESPGDTIDEQTSRDIPTGTLLTLHGGAPDCTGRWRVDVFTSQRRAATFTIPVKPGHSRSTAPRSPPPAAAIRSSPPKRSPSADRTRPPVHNRAGAPSVGDAPPAVPDSPDQYAQDPHVSPRTVARRTPQAALNHLGVRPGPRDPLPFQGRALSDRTSRPATRGKRARVSPGASRALANYRIEGDLPAARSWLLLGRRMRRLGRTAAPACRRSRAEVAAAARRRFAIPVSGLALLARGESQGGDPTAARTLLFA